jgi:cellulose synthase/poly-beta-1,6-N-acetylglucosamine synthase-like glycosyltransferase
MLVLNLFINKEYKCSENALPEISIIISVFNEEKVIESTIRNFLKSNYDLNKIEFIIGSDNSTDSTNQIIINLQKEIPAIRFFPFTDRRGKSQVLNDLIKHAKSEILVFSDANTIYHINALKNMIKYYADNRVGGVSGKLNLLEFEESKSSGSQEKRYWDFETWLKGKEGKLGKLIGANGGIYSIRKTYLSEIPSLYPVMDDFFLSLKVLEQNKDFLYQEEANADEYTAASLKAEFNRKIRNNSIMLSTIRSISRLLYPKYRLVSYGLWSHKIIRWFSPVLLIIIFVSSFFLITYKSIFLYFFIIQLVTYLFGVLGFGLKKLNFQVQPLLLIFYFMLTNLAMLIGIVKFIFGKHTAHWQSTPRI